MNEEGLRACPFCGSDDVYARWYDDYDENGVCYKTPHVTCNYCSGSVEPVAYATENDTLAQVKNRWNRRSLGRNPIAIALQDYLDTDNFAGLAVVLDEEKSRIDAELDRPVTAEDCEKAGFEMFYTRSEWHYQIKFRVELNGKACWRVAGHVSNPLPTLRHFRALCLLFGIGEEK